MPLQKYLNSEAIMFRKALLVGLPVLLILLIIYYYLGGFNETSFDLVQTDNYVIAGYEYQGPYEQDDLQELFFQVQDFVETGALVGTITVVNYQLDFEAQDSVRQLIGVQIKELPLTLPEGIEIDTISASEAVRATIKAHPLVMPNPEDTQQQIQDFAQARSLELSNLVLEQYVGEEEIWVDVPLR